MGLFMFNQLKKRLVTRPMYRVGLVIIFLAAAIVIGQTVFGENGIGVGASDSKLEKLMKKMGFLNVPLLPPPVDIVLEDVEGRTVKLSDFNGKVVFLNFWTTWCPTCRVEMPSMEKLHNRFKDEDFIMLAVDLKESVGTVKAFREKYKLSFPILMDTDGKYANLYGVRSIPTTYVLHKNGGIVGKAFGPREWDSNASIKLFDYLVNGENNSE